MKYIVISKSAFLWHALLTITGFITDYLSLVQTGRLGIAWALSNVIFLHSFRFCVAQWISITVLPVHFSMFYNQETLGLPLPCTRSTAPCTIILARPDDRLIWSYYLIFLLRTVYTLYTHCIHIVYTLYTHCIHTVYTLYTHCIHTVYTLYTHCIHTVYTLYTLCILRDVYQAFNVVTHMAIVVISFFRRLRWQ